MAITTYSELKTAIADFLNRDDLTSVIPTFISLAESQINRDIRHWRMEVREDITLNAEYVNLPATWIETIQLHIKGNGTEPLKIASRETIADKRSADEDTANTPKYYAHAAGQIELWPTPSSSLTGEILYYQSVEALSDSNTSNWLLSDSPDIYLYGALVHSAPYLQEDGRANTWAQLYGAAVQRLNIQSEISRMSGSGLTMKIRGLG